MVCIEEGYGLDRMRYPFGGVSNRNRIFDHVTRASSKRQYVSIFREHTIASGLALYCQDAQRVLFAQLAAPPRGKGTMHRRAGRITQHHSSGRLTCWLCSSRCHAKTLEASSQILADYSVLPTDSMNLHRTCAFTASFHILNFSWGRFNLFFFILSVKHNDICL